MFFLAMSVKTSIVINHFASVRARLEIHEWGLYEAINPPALC